MLSLDVLDVPQQHFPLHVGRRAHHVSALPGLDLHFGFKTKNRILYCHYTQEMYNLQEETTTYKQQAFILQFADKVKVQEYIGSRMRFSVELLMRRRRFVVLMTDIHVYKTQQMLVTLLNVSAFSFRSQLWESPPTRG